VKGQSTLTQRVCKELLAQEIQDDPYGEGAVSEATPRFYPHESIVAAVVVS
jgi:hypothetical protein